MICILSVILAFFRYGSGMFILTAELAHKAIFSSTITEFANETIVSG